MKKTSTRLSLLSMLLFAWSITGWAQAQTPLETAMRYLEDHSEEWQLTAADIADVVVSDMYTSRHNQATHIYFNQRYSGIELYNAINGVHLKNTGEVVFATNRFTPDLASKINTTEPAISAYAAILSAADHLNLPVLSDLRLLEQVGDRQFTYSGGTISNTDIKAQLVYQLMADGKAYLAWDFALDVPTSADYWSLRVNALTAEVLDQYNWTLYCSFDDSPHQHTHDQSCGITQHNNKQSMSYAQALEAESQLNNDNAQYNVWAIPAESPAHGDRGIVVNPADPTASPYGWHDINGQEGPEFTITRGNNVHAYQDSDGDNTPNGDEPDGGEELIFDFPADLNMEPNTYREAATTQLFYMNNIMHDMAYRYGLDEAAGNFQQNNYGNGGSGGDYVQAEAQDGSGENNANFATPPDGGNGRMQMYLWTGGGSVFTVNSPQPVSGGYLVQEAAFGATITTTPVTGNVIIVDDGTGEATLGCNPPVNGDQLEGAVALIDRGSCEFGLKCLNAQEAGAIGVIVCNFEDDLISMGAGAVGGQVNIPAVMMGATDCQTIRQFAGVGLNVTFQVPEDNGPERVDGTLDNGIVAHEYGHGISNRLTGGPSAAGCLSNGEQAGEGWSDYFALVTSVRPGDTGEMGRGIGTFALRQDNNGPGIRRQRYSTDFNVNNQTYIDIAGQGVHATGEIWVTATWDLYWAMVELYGWDPDPINGTGGNNMAIQLVMDGMALQACNPGYEDSRDGILAADQLNYDGVHECLIYEVFARRGMGYFFDQGTAGSNSDGQENFETRPQCIPELKIKKEVTDFINPGDEIEVTLTLTNHKGEPVTEVMVEEELLEGLSFVAGSETGATATVNGSLITFEVGEIAHDETKTVTYTLASDPNLFSIRQFFDGMEDGDDNWFFQNLDPEGFDIWSLTQTDAYEGETSWYVPNTEAENDQVVFLDEAIEITGEKPALRFYHKYDIEVGADGGFIEVSTDGGFTWSRVAESMIRNGYNAIMTYGTLAIPNLGSFSGESDGWIPTYVDLSNYIGEAINIRWRFGSDLGNTNPNVDGWYVDNVELMDLFNYNNETCVMSAEGDLACATASDAGTIVESMVLSNTGDEVAQNRISVFPNPANDLLNVAIDITQRGNALLTITSLDGKLLLDQNVTLDGFAQLIPVNVASLQAGMYFVKVQTGATTYVEKVVVR
jgi:extracellular elastinolytic metalloproteinase